MDYRCSLNDLPLSIHFRVRYNMIQGGGRLAVYLDNAATSFPKPEKTHQAVEYFSREIGASSGRGAYKRALAADKVMFEARSSLAMLFGVEDPSRIVFTFSATDSISLVFSGFWKR